MKIVWGRSIGWNIEFNRMVQTTQPIPMSYNGMSKFSPSTFTPMKSHIITDGADCYPWTETFIWWPVKSISGKRLWWCKAFRRKVWIVWGTGFHMEPETQYATAFDMITDASKVMGS
jgi:hypothetical protein